jgi:transposase
VIELDPSDIFREYGIDVELVPGDYTSKECSICRAKHKTEGYIEGCMNARKPGGRSMQILMQH